MCARELAAAREATREAVIQQTDRLQQLVAAQSEMAALRERVEASERAREAAEAGRREAGEQVEKMAGEVERLRREVAATREKEAKERREKETAVEERRRCEEELSRFVGIWGRRDGQSEAMAELKSLVAKLRGDSPEEASQNMPDSIHQKNLTINQLKEENRRLISKVGVGSEREVAGDCEEADDGARAGDDGHRREQRRAVVLSASGGDCGGAADTVTTTRCTIGVVCLNEYLGRWIGFQCGIDTIVHGYEPESYVSSM